jgi:hypothetical protein
MDVCLHEYDETETIQFHDNSIEKTPDGYFFEAPYEVSIDDCEIKNIIESGGLTYIHVDISGTEAQETLGIFITEVAQVCHLEKDISISNILLVIPPDLDIDSSKGQDLSFLRRMHASEPGTYPNLVVLKDHNADLVMEWVSFQILNGDIRVNLVLTDIMINDMVTPPRPTVPTLSLMDILKASTVEIIDATSINTDLNTQITDDFSVYYSIDTKNEDP